MNFDSYSEGQTICLTEGRCIDCAYIFYTTDKERPVLASLTAKNISIMCTDTLGVLRTKGVICKTVDDNNIHIVLTSKGGERLGVNTPIFNAGVKIYNIAVAVSGHSQEDDILMVSTELTNNVIVPAGTHIITEIDLTLA